MTDGRRGDIQGLRAVAVLAVVSYHVLGMPRAGFLGVDVFLVVSGFVITGVLLRDAGDNGRPDLAHFYARRARRILPLAVLVIGLTVVAARATWAPEKAASVQTDALWSLLFAANWHLAARGSDYFQQGAQPSPVQHFWSLGVEEQFYLAWPLLVLLVVAAARGSGRSRRGLVALAGVLLVASLCWGWVQASHDPTVAYYSSLTRAWELALGCVLAALPLRQPSRTVRAALSWLGLAGIVGSVALVPTGWGTPVPAAVPVALSTALVLVAGVGTGRGSVVLTNPVSRFVGDISYGLYLWHLPVATVVAAYLTSGTARYAALVLAMTAVLSVASSLLLERPVLDAPDRRQRHSSGAPAAWAGWWRVHRRPMRVGGLVVLLLVGGGASANAAWPGWWEDGEDAAPQASPGTTSPSPTGTMTAVAPTPRPPAEVPLGATGTRLQDGLRAALASRVWPARLSPPASDLKAGTNPWPGFRACNATDVADPRSCTYGNPRGPEIVVYGDSLGVNLMAATVTAYGKTHKVRGLTKLACAVNGADADFGKDEWSIPCTNHRKAVVAYVTKARPRMLLMVETYAWAVKLKSGAKGAAREAEWLAADQAFVDSVKGSVGHVVIVSPSLPGVGFYDCYRRGGSPRRCTTGVPDWWRSTQDAERRVRGATFLDTLHWYCVEGRCPIYTGVGDTLMKVDYLHTTYQYGQVVAADLRYRLTAAGIVP